MAILDNLQAQLKAQGILATPQPVHLVVAFSGGPDSTALLYLMAELAKTQPVKITAAYFHHRWRQLPPKELPILHKHTAALGVPLVIIDAPKGLPKTEAVARSHRYKQLTQLASDIKADAVLTAHHADDQVETVLFRVLRGTGADGLAGIQQRLVLNPPEGQPVPILRPLLETPKLALMEYLKNQGIGYFDDPTNQDKKHHRNLLRLEVLPTLEKHFPHLKNTLFKMSVVMAGDSELIEKQVDPLWQDVYKRDKSGIYLDALTLSQLDIPYQRRILKRFFETHQLPVEFQTIDSTLAFIRGDGRNNLSSALHSLKYTEAGERRFLSLYKSRLRLVNVPVIKTEQVAVPVVLGQITPAAEFGLTLEAIDLTLPELLKSPEARERGNAPTLTAEDNERLETFDLNLDAFLTAPEDVIQIRTRLPGDRFQPKGMKCSMRFKKLLINKGVPRFERDAISVVAVKETILWAQGYGVSEQVKASETRPATHRLALSYKK